MHPALSSFIRQIAGAAAAALMAVVVTAFLTMPFILERHPGDPHRADGTALRHMT